MHRCIDRVDRDRQFEIAVDRGFGAGELNKLSESARLCMEHFGKRASEAQCAKRGRQLGE